MVLLVGERTIFVGVFLPEEEPRTGVLLPDVLILDCGAFVVIAKRSATVGVDLPVGVDDLNPLLCSGPIGESGVRFKFSTEGYFFSNCCTGDAANERYPKAKA